MGLGAEFPPGEGGSSAHTARGLGPPTAVLWLFPWGLVIFALFV